MSYGLGSFGVGYGPGDPYGVTYQNKGVFLGTGTVDLSPGILWDSGVKNSEGTGSVPALQSVIFFKPHPVVEGESGFGGTTKMIYRSSATAPGVASGEAGEQVGLGWDALDDDQPLWTEIKD